MTTLINTEGWLYLTDGVDIMKIQYKGLTAQWHWKDVKIKHYLSSSRTGSHYSYWFGAVYWKFKFEELWFDNYTHYQSFMQYIWDWQRNDGGFTLKVYKDSSNNFWAFDYTNTEYTVMLSKGLPQITKKPADNQIYVLREVEFEQSG